MRAPKVRLLPCAWLSLTLGQLACTTATTPCASEASDGARCCDFARAVAGEELDLSLPLVFDAPGGFDAEPSSSNWSPSQLSRRHGQERVQVSHPAFLVAAVGLPLQTQSLAQFLETAPYQTDSNASIVFESPFIMKKAAEFEGELSPPPGIASAFRGARPILSIGASSSGLGFHAHAAAWQRLFHGRKLWLLYPPGEMPSASLHAVVNVKGRSEFEATRELRADKRPLRCLQGPGEVVYVPPGYLHATRNLELSIGLGGLDVQRGWEEEAVQAASTAARRQTADLDGLLHTAGDPNMRRKAAVKLLRRARDAAPGDIRSYLQLAALFKRGGAKGARKAIKVLLSAASAVGKHALESSTPDILHSALLVRLARELVLLGAFEQALPVCAEAHKLDPRSSAAMGLLGMAHAKTGDTKTAKHLFNSMDQQSLVYDPDLRKVDLSEMNDSDEL